MGVILALVLLEGGLRVVGWGFSLRQQSTNRARIESGADVVIVALGESTTALGGRHSYPAQLEQVLSERHVDTTFSVLNRGIPGATSGKLVDELVADMDRLAPDIVVVMMGLNDGFLPRQEGSTGKESPDRPLRVIEAVELIGQEIGKKRSNLQPIETEERASQCGAVRAMLDNDYHGAVRSLTTTLRSEPLTTTSFVCLARSLEAIGRLNEAHTTYLKAAHVDPSPVLQVQRARFIEVRGFPAVAESLYRAVLEADAGHPLASFRLGSLLVRDGRAHEAEPYLSSLLVSSDLTSVLTTSSPDCQKEAVMALGLHPGWVDFDLERYLARAEEVSGDDLAAERLLVAGVEGGKRGFRGDDGVLCSRYEALVGLYARQGRDDEIVALWRKPADPYPAATASCFREVFGRYFAASGQRERAASCFEPSSYYGAQTAVSFGRLLEATRAVDAVLVCVQYPGRSIAPLKRLFPDEDDVVYVDNGPLFREALDEHEYAELFMDRFFGDFGHATALGNRLLADNVADVLLDEVLTP